MKKILIADSNKSSLVMTSEIFKDCYPGIQVCIAQTAQETVKIIEQNENFDVFVIDFDLPDQNGFQTAIKIKKLSKKPIILTASNEADVQSAFGKQLNKHQDIQSFLKKPLHSNVVQAYCEYHCKQNYTFQKPVPCCLSVLVAFVNTARKLKPVYYPAIVDECCLHSVRVQLLDSTVLKDLKSVNQVFVRFQSPLEIELAQNLSFNSITDFNMNKLMDKFNYEFNGKLISKIDSHSPINGAQKFWVQCENVRLSQRILEAVLRDQQNKQYYAMQRFF